MTRINESKIIRIMHPICWGLDVHKASVSACVIFPDDNGQEQYESLRHLHGRSDVSAAVADRAWLSNGRDGELQYVNSPSWYRWLVVGSGMPSAWQPGLGPSEAGPVFSVSCP